MTNKHYHNLIDCMSSSGRLNETIELIKRTDIVLGVYETGFFVAFGRDLIDGALSTLSGTDTIPVTIEAFEVRQSTEDVAKLLALVQEAKGYHDYQPTDEKEIARLEALFKMK